jgi:hypothetical protein
VASALRSCRSLLLALSSTLVAGVACSESLPDPIEVPCTPAQPAPYPTTSYAGVHANRENNDVIACASGSAFRETWHALRGLAIAQPNTFSPDGRTTYVTTANPDPAGCRLHALDVATGNVVWCKNYPQSIVGSAVEVDEAGDLYFTADRFVHSLAADGTERWSAELGTAPMMGDEFGTGPLGVHFTPGGHVATVTNDGTVVLVARDDGRVLASLSIPTETGFVPPRALAGVDLATLLPSVVVDDLRAVFGASAGGGTIGAFLGAGGGFSDNTIGVSSRDEIFVIGGGPDDEHGALVQIRVEGTALAIGWHLVTNAGSATSPSITPDGHFVSVGDGSNAAALLDPRTAMGRLVVADVDACDANTDADADPSVCAGAYEVALERGPIAGSPPLLPDGTLVFWEASPNSGVFGPELRDVAVIGASGVVWESVLDGGLDWTSVITITDTHPSSAPRARSRRRGRAPCSRCACPRRCGPSRSRSTGRRAARSGAPRSPTTRRRRSPSDRAAISSSASSASSRSWRSRTARRSASSASRRPRASRALINALLPCPRPCPCPAVQKSRSLVPALAPCAGGQRPRHSRRSRGAPPRLRDS